MTGPNVNPQGRTAVEKLAISKLSDQREGLADWDVSKINLAVRGIASVPIRGLVTKATIQRGIAGASTLTYIANDDQRKLLRCGIFGPSLTVADDFNKTALGQQIEFFKPIDTELDGLWFRLVNLQKAETGDALTLTFEDREVAVLRSYPKKDDPHTFRQFSNTWPRSRVMRWLIQEPTEFGVPIRIVSPMLDVKNPIIKPSDRPSAVHKGINHAPGFPAKGDSGITIKGSPPKPVQLANLERVLDVGVSMNATRRQLVCAVMVVTQESDAQTNATNGTHVGLFQQDSDPKSVWVQRGGATRIPEQDAHAFFTQLIAADASNPSIDAAALCEAVQASGHPAEYAQWRNEAENTISVYLGSDIGNTSFAGGTEPVSTGFFARGQLKVVGNSQVAIREDNWTALQRLASEVGWRCYCVSGTVYIETDAQIMGGAVRYQARERQDGVDTIGLNIDTGRSRAQATMSCRARTWQAPPGTVVQLLDMGPGNGRWFVSNIQRDLFSPDATVTLSKPQPTLLDAESATPIQATQLAVSGSGTVTKATLVGSDSPIRAAIVAAARKAVTLEQTQGYYAYLEVRPMPYSLFAKPAPVPIDCSAFATLVYKAGGAPDPNDRGYDGAGNTATLWAHGTLVITPSAGDLVFYGHDTALGPDAPAHVAVSIGAGQIVNMGSPNSGEPKVMNETDIPLTFRGYRTYPLATG